MRDVDSWINQAATAAFDKPDGTNFVFVMRKILTAAWREGFESGQSAQFRDISTARHVNDLIVATGQHKSGT